ncbi:hypothetical protein PVAG01_08509 [Phlyctema vagabunda]|uniref:Sister chromatid cohesion protein DCC1 n=1 Tax=Phlyctema vagabunda TaxID=108571 RepID=A0ABR4P9L2_9HELO
MSSQEAGIPFSAAHQQQPFKLLELPPELLAALESDDPPALTIRAAADDAAGHALLCSADKTYQVRQKNTSNPIMILQPSSTDASSTEGEHLDALPIPSVCSIAAIQDTLELVVHDTSKSATAAAVPKKVNKWHEKFAKGRTASKSKD